MSFSGLADIQKQGMVNTAADAKMPMAKIFGLSAAGFNSGEDDIENYNALVEGEVRAKAKMLMNKIIPIVCRKVLGVTPDRFKVKFKALRVMSAEQEENVKSLKHQRYYQDYQAGVLTAKEYAQICKQENLCPIDTEVLNGKEPEPPMMAQMADSEGEGGSIPTGAKKFGKEGK